MFILFILAPDGITQALPEHVRSHRAAGEYLLEHVNKVIGLVCLVPRIIFIAGCLTVVHWEKNYCF